jgi:hypothetical protein
MRPGIIHEDKTIILNRHHDHSSRSLVGSMERRPNNKRKHIQQLNCIGGTPTNRLMEDGEWRNRAESSIEGSEYFNTNMLEHSSEGERVTKKNNSFFKIKGVLPTNDVNEIYFKGKRIGTGNMG